MLQLDGRVSLLRCHAMPQADAQFSVGLKIVASIKVAVHQEQKIYLILKGHSRAHAGKKESRAYQ